MRRQCVSSGRFRNGQAGPRTSRAVPSQQAGRWVAAAIILIIAVALGRSVVTNGIPVTSSGDYLLTALLHGLRVTIELR